MDLDKELKDKIEEAVGSVESHMLMAIGREGTVLWQVVKPILEVIGNVWENPELLKA